MHDDAADIAARVHVGIPLVDLVKWIPGCHQFVEAKSALAIELQHERDIPRGAGRAKQRTLDTLLKEGEHRRRHRNANLGHVADAREDTRPALSNGIDPLSDMVP